MAPTFQGDVDLCKRGQDDLERYSSEPQKRARSLHRSILICLGCVVVSSVVVVMEAYALLALQFCDGENLISLYWSTWTMIQVGSLIAMMGIILAFAHALRNRRHPPWALALGTPVLVIAGILHLCHDSMKKRLGRRRKTDEATNGDPRSLSEVNTIQENPDDDDVDIDTATLGEFIGFTVEGGAIVRFNNTPPMVLENCEVLGYCDSNRPIVAYRKDSIRFIPASEQEDVSAESKSRAKEKAAETVRNAEESV